MSRLEIGAFNGASLDVCLVTVVVVPMATWTRAVPWEGEISSLFPPLSMVGRLALDRRWLADDNPQLLTRWRSAEVQVHRRPAVPTTALTWTGHGLWEMWVMWVVAVTISQCTLLRWGRYNACVVCVQGCIKMADHHRRGGGGGTPPGPRFHSAKK